jgi:hypothetical protein
LKAGLHHDGTTRSPTAATRAVQAIRSVEHGNLAENMLPECKPAFREPDRHIFITFLIFHVLQESIASGQQPAGKESSQRGSKKRLRGFAFIEWKLLQNETI